MSFAVVSGQINSKEHELRPFAERAASITPERLQSIRLVFESVVALAMQERELALRDTEQGDPTLAAEVRQLISAYERRDGFIERPLANVQVLLEPSKDQLNVIGKAIGPYRLLQLIGEGGMGEVWLAEQSFPVWREVAVKLIKTGMDTREVVARFESERQALALMCHPTIAKVFEAGSTPEGRPYFAMEYVPGSPITSYCSQYKLTVHERIELFVRVCEGVQHAHQKAIIHRDLKPSNILVIELDGKPAPKIIDFGVARATAERLPEETFFTRVGSVIGTPDYMSPEQACSAGLDIDTRTDVYSLGVILYELLTGALPFNFRPLALDEIFRKLREDDPPRPSTKLRSFSERSAQCGSCGSEPAVLMRQLRGDLDAIALKALEKDRSRRYGTPAELADDLERYLRHKPVVARSASVSYRARKYARRHQVGVAVTCLILVLIATFGIAEAIQLRRITRERDRANRIAGFMTGMFRLSNPSESQGNKITAREILDRASKDLGTGLADDPEFQAQMMDAIGGVYYNLGLYTQAESLLRPAVQIRRRILGTDDGRTAKSMHELANAIYGEGRYPEAEKLDRETLAIRQRIYGQEHPETLRSINNLAVVLVARGREREAAELHRSTFDLQRRLLGPEHPDTLLSMNNLSLSLGELGMYIESERLQREQLEVQKRHFGLRHPDTLNAMGNLAWTLDYEGRYAEAEKFDRDALEGQRLVLGPEHPVTLTSIDTLTQILEDEGRYKEAETVGRKALEVQRRVVGPEHPDTLFEQSNLAEILRAEGGYREAEKLQRQVVDVEGRVLGTDHPRTLFFVSRLAKILILEEQLDVAEKLSLATREAQLRAVGADYPDTAATTYNLASIAAYRGRADEALLYLRSAIDHGLRPNAISRMEKDPALRPLQRDSRFKPLVLYARQHAIDATTPH